MTYLLFLVRAVVMVCASVLLVGCGGGGSTTPSPTPSPYDEHVKWVTDILDDRLLHFSSNPVVSKSGSVIVAAHEDEHNTEFLYAFDGESGNIRWRQDLGVSENVLGDGTPAEGADGTIFVQGESSTGTECSVFAVNGTDGNFIWIRNFSCDWGNLTRGSRHVRHARHQAGLGLGDVMGLGDIIPHNEGSPAVGADGTVFVSINALDQSAVYALDGTDGSIKWQFNQSWHHEFGSPVAAPDGSIIFGDSTVFGDSTESRGLSVYALHGGNGSLLWKTAGTFIPDGPECTIDYSIQILGLQRTVLVNSPCGLEAVDLQNGSTKWQIPRDPATYYDPSYFPRVPAIGGDGAIFLAGSFVNGTGSFYALEPNSGILKWNYTSEGTWFGEAAVSTGGIIYVCEIAEGYSVWAFDAKTGTFKWRSSGPGYLCDGSDNTPVVGADGTLFTIAFSTLGAFFGEGKPVELLSNFALATVSV